MLSYCLITSFYQSCTLKTGYIGHRHRLSGRRSDIGSMGFQRRWGHLPCGTPWAMARGRVRGWRQDTHGELRRQGRRGDRRRRNERNHEQYWGSLAREFCLINSRGASARCTFICPIFYLILLFGHGNLSYPSLLCLYYLIIEGNKPQKSTSC